MRVALLTNTLTPYRLPVYRELGATPGWQLRIFLSAESEPHWDVAFRAAFAEGVASLDVERVASLGFERRQLTHRGAGIEQRVSTHVPWGTLGALRRFRPDVVVSTELGARSLFAALYTAWHRTPLVLWSHHARVSAQATGGARRRLRRALLARADAVIGMGVQAREVLRDLGVPDARLFDAPNAHDAPAYERALAELDSAVVPHALRGALRARERIALVAGRLVPIKGVLPLLAAWVRLPESLRERWTLLFVGDGPLAPAVRDAARARPGEIAWLPQRPPGEMPAIHAAADLHVFASLGDTWGLVVNEALACGVPVLCSRLAGCADDLIESGRNGWLFDPTDAQDFVKTLHEALSCSELGRMSVAALDTGKRFGPGRMADGVRRAVDYALSRRAAS
ncbi:MAG TPA: glycosyltransferase family 4 protein [Myxococcota bacterium]|nr:glycosyltransferase family 4 protein [Myxococcota bacterium]